MARFVFGGALVAVVISCGGAVRDDDVPAFDPDPGPDPGARAVTHDRPCARTIDGEACREAGDGCRASPTTCCFCGRRGASDLAPLAWSCVELSANDDGCPTDPPRAGSPCSTYRQCIYCGGPDAGHYFCDGRTWTLPH